MEEKNPKEIITDLIVRGKTEAALEELITQLEGNDSSNDAVLLTAQYNQLSRQMRLGVISNSDAAIRQNQIVNSILELLKELEVVNDPELSTDENVRVVDNRKKLALVIGCNEYEHAGPLKNPINDARGIKKNLEQLGFTVSLRENPDLKELKIAVDDFGIELQNFDVGIFYFAGHGVQVRGQNYLIPVDANLSTERLVEYNCVRADRVFAHMEQGNTEVNIIILDACRNNPFERSWSRSIRERGLAFMDAPQGSFIAYATSPGKTASDGAGENGLYTGELMKHIGERGISINQMFQRVRASVMKISQNKQTPWEATSLTADFYFNN